MALTDEQIIEIRKTERAVVTTPWGDTLAFSRAIEAAAVAPLLARIAALTAQVEQAAQPVALDHIACIDDGELRFMSGRKAPSYDCELYAMPDGKSAPLLYTAPPKAVPMTEDVLKEMHHEDQFGLFCDYDDFEQIARAVEQAHGITPATVEKGETP